MTTAAELSAAMDERAKIQTATRAWFHAAEPHERARLRSALTFLVHGPGPLTPADARATYDRAYREVEAEAWT